VVTLELEGGHAAVREFVAGLESFSLAESLGGVESLVAHPATMTHAAMDPAAREKADSPTGSSACRSGSKRSMTCARTWRERSPGR